MREPIGRKRLSRKKAQTAQKKTLNCRRLNVFPFLRLLRLFVAHPSSEREFCRRVTLSGKQRPYPINSRMGRASSGSRVMGRSLMSRT